MSLENLFVQRISSTADKRSNRSASLDVARRGSRTCGSVVSERCSQRTRHHVDQHGPRMGYNAPWSCPASLWARLQGIAERRVGSAGNGIAPTGQSPNSAEDCRALIWRPGSLSLRTKQTSFYLLRERRTQSVGLLDSARTNRSLTRDILMT